ncbi:hypothetical protein BKA64DRAFT_701492 [Cadophora sp. MPI-SDFR-AT-0126]|nr:hypothetical protein BKA64DRAFT_701492 [Leotiomycetes sp. MPI-SDFR-AT-0126]
MPVRLESLSLSDTQSQNGDHEFQTVKKSLPTKRLEEYDIDFSDTRKFAVSRWGDIREASRELLFADDLQICAHFNTWDDLAEEIDSRICDPASTALMKREMSKIQSLPRVLAALAQIFATSVTPYEADFGLVWGMIYLTLKMSYSSTQRLRRIVNVFVRIRRAVELFNGNIEACDKIDEARIATIDFLDPMLNIISDMVDYLHESASVKIAEDLWPEVNERINGQTKTLDLAVKHVNDLTNYSKANRDLEILNIKMKHALMPEDEERGSFPVKKLPFERNERFYGRRAELDEMLECLRPRDDHSFRTYTIYGKRGVGKTAMALQFAYANEKTYDAIFWIQCETSVTIRQSFTNVAMALNIPAADRDGRHEENQMAVQKWLKKTKKKWLLVFDNVENEKILQSYWPVGASGAVLITSRKYHNFIHDLCRKGSTVKPFTPNQSWELLLELLGPEWKKLNQDRKIDESDVSAAKAMLKDLEGLALAIEQMAILIKDENIGGPNIAKTYEMFKDRRSKLPQRHSTERPTWEQSLDTLWDIIFRCLSPNARVLIGVLAWMSPDGILIKLFLPRNQSALSGNLSFCQQDPVHIDPNNRASLFSIITPSPQFDAAIEELRTRKLIKQDNQLMSIHRVVQEAVNFHSIEDLQQSFDAACRLVYEQFPKRKLDEDLYSAWYICQDYISHVIHLSKRFSEFSKSGKLTASSDFVKLLSNAAWYLYELGDYDACTRVVETGIAACDKKKPQLFANLRTTEGCLYYELNRLEECRKAWEEAQRLRKTFLPHAHPGLAAMYNNIGNLELATGDIKKAMTSYENALQIWVAGGDETANALAVTYLCMGRVYMLQGKYDEAHAHTTYSSELLGRTVGADKGFQAFVHYAYGNIYFRQSELELAWRAYDASLKIGLARMPIHPITAAAWYSLGCVEFTMGNNATALFDFEKAKAILRLRSPTRDDGPIARLLWKTAVILDTDPDGESKADAAKLRLQARQARQELVANGEGGEVPYDERDGRDRSKEEDSFAALVPLFYR